jgi:hypothetical protein
VASKVCPQCKRVTGASAETCPACGHSFEVVTPVVTRRPLRCVMCGVVNAAKSMRCECGAAFERDPGKLRLLAVERRGVARGMMANAIALAALAVVVAVGTFVILGLSRHAVRGAVGGFAAAAALMSTSVVRARKARRILEAIETNLEELDDLPTARVVQR